MAMDPAPPSRNLWQLPLFLLGIAAVVGVWFGRPYWRVTAAEQFERDLNALRQSVDKVPVDAAHVQSLLRKVQGIDPPGPLEAKASYLVGSALAAVAEVLANSDEADEQWKAARKLLEKAEELGVPESDRSRLQHRLAKTWIHTGEPAAKVIEALVKTLDCGDDPGEANRLLAELYLKIDPPETKKARDRLKEYLARVIPGRGEAQARQLSLARLQLGELSTKLGETEEARKALEKIGPDAPPEILAAARTELGKSYAHEEDWPQAIRCLEQARDVRGSSAAQKGSTLYLLADYYLRANPPRRAEAYAALDQLRRHSGPEGPAAGLKLAELQLRDPRKRDDAAFALESALGGIKTAAEYQNKLLPLAAARAIFEEAVLKYRTANSFDLAVRAARAYAPIAENSRDRELAAEALQAWGQSLLDQVPRAPSEDRPPLEADGSKKIRDAAKEWHHLATLRTKSIEKGEALYRAADLYLRAGDKDEALKMLDLLGLQVPDFPEERQAEVWLKKGQIYLALDNREQAKLCFQNGIQSAERHPSPALLQCRVRLAELLLKSGDPKSLGRALGDLEKALADMSSSQDKELHQKTLLFVADAYYKQKEYRKAEVRLRTLLDTYPDSPRTVYARYQLGQCYWFTAGQEAEKCKAARKIIDDPATSDEQRREANETYEKNYTQYKEWLKKAAEPFRAVETQLLQGMTNPKLQADDADLLRRASLAAADCAFYLGEFDESIAHYDAIANRYAGTVVQLEALRQKFRSCQYKESNSIKAIETLTQIRTAFLTMPDTEFDGSSEIRLRDYWKRWLEQSSPKK